MWNQNYDSDSEPITCAKCEIRFNTEIERKEHEVEKHRKKIK